MTRSGIFQIAFDHDRYGNKSAVKQEPSGTGAGAGIDEDEQRWIHEQRLQIDHPDFFCGQGGPPPVGIDNGRPRGAWFLHERAVTQPQPEQEREQQQPAALSPPAACSRTPHDLSNGGGGGPSRSSDGPAFPQSWNPVSHGDDSGDLGSSAVAAAAQASADATDSVQVQQEERDASDLLGV